MAADRPLAERGLVEIKMGRSKFPGKPSKIGNRKRVNLSSCALPEENDSSKAAKNIYLGLSVFNETFGDNEMVAPGPFHGFSMSEVEEAMAEARLQQKEAEVEHKSQGININLWEIFQTELFAITSCSSAKSVSNLNNADVNKSKLSFDGGGSSKKTDSKANLCDNSDKKPSKTFNKKSIIKRCKQIMATPEKNVKRVMDFHSPRLKLKKLHCSPGSKKSLQSQAAKKLLEKAKMSNLTDNSKNAFTDKKFVLPSQTIQSRFIKSNKKFENDGTGQRKYLRSSAGLLNKEKQVNSSENNSSKVSNDSCISEHNGDNEKKKCLKKEVKSRTASNTKSPSLSLSNSSTGKIILREPRLQLDKSSISLLEGPFSTPSASSLSPSSQLKASLMQSVITPGNKVCGVCGVVKFYKVVEIPKKFGIHCCEFCQNFISNIINSLESKTDTKLQCLKGNGLCRMSSMKNVKSHNFNIGGHQDESRCQACWLQLCLKNFKMPIKLKQRLLNLLPVNIQMNINLELYSISKATTQNFTLTSNINNFSWLNDNSNHDNIIHPKENVSEKTLDWSNISDSNKTLRKRARNARGESSTKMPMFKGETSDEKNRQQITLKGPRVKHVCRSASVALGQPLATFPLESSPSKKSVADSLEDSNPTENCDNDIVATSLKSETQGFINKSLSEVTAAQQGNKDKKSIQGGREVNDIAKPSKSLGQGPGAKSKKKTNAKVEDPVSMDFWESYDPEEICETGFGLIGSEPFTVRALCFLCGSSGYEKLIHCASCCEPYHEFCVDEAQLKLYGDQWRFDWVCPSCTICFTCGKTSGQQLRCVKCENSYHTECVDRVGGRLLHSPDRPWVCSACLRCKSCNGVDVSVFVGNLPLCKSCFVLRQKGNYCPLCQRCYEDDDYDSKMMECGQCKCWVHAKCEGLSDEKYQVLSFLPESVEYVCRMCCVIPPAPWWLAVEAELKSGYLGVLKALSKNRKACTMLKWSPRKQCTCRQINFVSRVLDFEDTKMNRGGELETNTSVTTSTEEKLYVEQSKEGKFIPASVSERKTSIEVITHPTESLKLTLKIMKETDSDGSEKTETSEDNKEKYNNNDTKVRVKKCPSNGENSEDSLANTFDCREDGQTSIKFLSRGNSFGLPGTDFPYKRSLSSPVNPPSDSGIGSTDDELKANSLTDEESCKMEEHQNDSNRAKSERKSNCDSVVSFLDEKKECFCFLEVDSYNSRSKPFSPNLLAIKKKVTTSEYSSLHQFHQDMERMIETTHSVDLMDLYHQTVKEIFPWFDPKFSRVQNSSQKVLGSVSHESTPIKNTPIKNATSNECRALKERLRFESADYFYCDYVVEDERTCLLCKVVGDGLPGEAGRLLYCGQNEWVHCNCALWSGEVFEEIDGSLQNVQSAINRGRSIRCPQCNLKGASIGCCARNCQETYHFGCARKIGCIFMDDKTMYCPQHIKESLGKLVQNEKEFEIRRPVYVELDKRKMKSVESNQIRFAVGALQINNLGRFINTLSDQKEAIVPDQFSCTRLYWSCYEPWRLVRYHFSVRLVEAETCEGVDFGVNFTIDHSREPEYVEMKLKQLKYFQEHNTFLELDEPIINESESEMIESPLVKFFEKSNAYQNEEKKVQKIVSKTIKDSKAVKKILDQFESKEEENCLSDNQNTADLLPPDLEEAIFKDLPNDILDGISMQDIFMDIKNDSFEGTAKDGSTIDLPDVDYNVDSSVIKFKKIESNGGTGSFADFWSEGNDSRPDTIEDAFLVNKLARDLKKNKLDVRRETGTLKTYQKTCNLNWSCRGDSIINSKRKKASSKCHVTVNLLEPQERGNMLQELKFTDGLVSITTGPITSMKDLKSRLEDGKRSIQEEGKENKCVSWQARLQPRLLQVDGGVDSSSSGSEAGESPQRVTDEGISSKAISSHGSLTYIDSSAYSINLLKHSDHRKLSFPTGYPNIPDKIYDSLSNDLPQLDGIADFQSDSSESDDDDKFLRLHAIQKRQRFEYSKCISTSVFDYKINQCDGGVDSECDEEDLAQCAFNDELAVLNKSDDEPVKCSKCHCTYRTKVSYQRHLESCSSDFMLSSSEGEMSDEESPKKNFNSSSPIIKPADVVLPSIQNTDADKDINEKDVGSVVKIKLSPVSPQSPASKTLENMEKLEVKKEKAVKRTYSRKKPTPNGKKALIANNIQQAPQILVQQPNSTLIVQDLAAPSVVPTAFIDSSPTVGYVTAIDPRNAFGKTLIATSNGIIPGSYQFPTVPEGQLLGGFCINPQNMQTNLPGFIIQQPQAPSTLLSSQPAPVMMASEQMMVGSTGWIQDPTTGRMFLTGYNQPIFYNMETIVSNTVMQSNQFVSNVLATSYSQTSTQIFRTSEMEQVVNIPPNYIVVGSNPPREELICLSTPPSFLHNPTPIQINNQNLFNPTISTLQTLNGDTKILSPQINPIQSIQPVCSPLVLGKINSANTNNVMGQPISQVVQKTVPVPTTLTAPSPLKTTSQMSSQSQPPIKSDPAPVIPLITNSEKSVMNETPKTKPLQPISRALVDYINNFRSDVSETVSPATSQVNSGIIANPPKPKPKPLPKIKELIPEHKVVNEKVETKPLVPPTENVTTSSSDSTCLLPNAKNKLESSPSMNKFHFSESTNITSPIASLAKITETSPDVHVKVNTLSSNVSSQKQSDKTEDIDVKCLDNCKEDLEIGASKPECVTPEVSNDKIELKELDVPSPVLAESTSNPTNSFERNNKECFNMPLLDDDPVPSVPVEEERVKINRDSETKTSPKDKEATDEILPLQENVQTANHPRKNKSPENSFLKDFKMSHSTSNEKTKNKKRSNLNDQNSMSNLLTNNNSSQPFDILANEMLKTKVKKLINGTKCEEKGPKLMFDVISDDGYKRSSASMVELWANICDSVQEMRASLKIPSMPVTKKGYEVLGMHNHGLQHCLEQLRGVEHCVQYQCKYFKREKPSKEDDEKVKGNLTGCARTEPFTSRKEYDMFAWLASKHRQLPKLTETAEETISSIRRANNLPLAMKYRNLKETAKLYVGVYRSKIHGRGLFCLREIEAGEMVIEYAGEVIRSTLTDKREKYYTDRGIGCYMFRIDDHFVVDATMKGNAARFINHSCEPNCYSKVVDILGKKHIVIFALRRINLMEELTYDYKFPFEDEKISCHCLSKKCKKYLN